MDGYPDTEVGHIMEGGTALWCFSEEKKIKKIIQGFFSISITPNDECKYMSYYQIG